MKKAILIAITIAMLAILAITVVPAYSWCLPPNPAGEDYKYETYGPHVDGIICKVYATTDAEWGDMLLGHVDIDDWSLNPAWLATFGAADGMWVEQNYGGEAGYYLIDVNNNATMCQTDTSPSVANPTSDFFLREAIAYACNRSDIVRLDSTATPIYTPMPKYMTGYINADIAPGQPNEALTYGGYTGDPATAIAILDAHHFPVGGDGWRYWDKNANGVKDAGEDMKLIFYSRGGLRGDYGDDLNTVLNTVLKINTDYHSHVSRGTVTGPVFSQEYYNMYTGGWIFIGPDPDYLCDLYNSSNYYHPGSPENYGGIRYADLDAQLTKIKLATSQAEGVAASKQSQYYFALHCASVPLWSVSGVKDYQNVPAQYYPDAPYGNWTDLVNQAGEGINSWWSTLNMYTSQSLYPPLYVYYGFSSTTSLQNEVYAQWYWDSEVLGRIYDGGAGRDPMTLASWIPQLYKSWEVGTWIDPVSKVVKTKVTIKIRPDVYWMDGVPFTVNDVMYTLTEISKDLLAKGFPPPWWYPTVQYMRSVYIVDDYTVEILLDVNSVWAVGWVIGSVIIPKHIWLPIVAASTVGSTNPRNVDATRPDDNIIGTGPFRWSDGVGDTVGSTVTLVANKPGSTVHGITSPGYYQYYPVEANIWTLLEFTNKTVLPLPPIGLDAVVPAPPLPPAIFGTMWVSAFPGGPWTCTSYERDVAPPGVSPGDVLNFMNADGKTIEVYVDDAVYAGGLVVHITGEVIDPSYLTSVLGQWNMIKPYAGNSFTLTDRVDTNLNGIVDEDDLVWLVNSTKNDLLYSVCFPPLGKYYTVFMIEKEIVPAPSTDVIYHLKVIYCKAKFNIPHPPMPTTKVLPLAFGIELTNRYLNDSHGGYLVVNKYVYIDGVLQPGYPKDVTLYTLEDGTIVPDKEEINTNTAWCHHNITVAVHIKGPATLTIPYSWDSNEPDATESFYTVPNPWISKWVNVTLHYWVTIIEDIGGTTFYDVIGLKTYPYKSELPAPDCKVNVIDILVAAKAFGSVPGDWNWSPTSDVNKDYKVNVIDILIIAKAFGIDP